MLEGVPPSVPLPPQQQQQQLQSASVPTSRQHLPAGKKTVSFSKSFLPKGSFCQDRLGTNIGITQQGESI
jgi:hypothetical protein